jgi:hypothetical protein
MDSSVALSEDWDPDHCSRGVISGKEELHEKNIETQQTFQLSGKITNFNDLINKTPFQSKALPQPCAQTRSKPLFHQTRSKSSGGNRLIEYANGSTLKNSSPSRNHSPPSILKKGNKCRFNSKNTDSESPVSPSTKRLTFEATIFHHESGIEKKPLSDTGEIKLFTLAK